MLVLLLVLAGVSGSYLHWRYVRPGPLPQGAELVVPHAGVAGLAVALQGDRLIDEPWAFRLAAKATAGAGPLFAGEYAFPAAASLRQVLGILRSGKFVQHQLTVPEGLTAAQISRLLDGAEPLVGDDVVPAEGEFLPQTYDYLRGVGRAALLARGRRALEQALGKAWDARAPGLPLATPREALILASIVERETGRLEERPHVASVFLNRLRRGMKLQSDPTVAYAATGGLGALGRPLSRGDLELDNPYNTYRYAGLPPGPICAPGIAAITAVLQPMLSDDLYFVADGTGGHAFSATLADHEHNVARWRALH